MLEGDFFGNYKVLRNLGDVQYSQALMDQMLAQTRRSSNNAEAILEKVLQDTSQLNDEHVMAELLGQVAERLFTSTDKKKRSELLRLCVSQTRSFSRVPLIRFWDLVSRAEAIPVELAILLVDEFCGMSPENFLAVSSVVTTIYAAVAPKGSIDGLEIFRTKVNGCLEQHRDNRAIGFYQHLFNYETQDYSVDELTLALQMLSAVPKEDAMLNIMRTDLLRITMYKTLHAVGKDAAVADLEKAIGNSTKEVRATLAVRLDKLLKELARYAPFIFSY